MPDKLVYTQFKTIKAMNDYLNQPDTFSKDKTKRDFVHSVDWSNKRVYEYIRDDWDML